ncbi:cysteine desulfurase [Candidatus Saccharibacteria bacterium]|nr:cysteine desulfurase [Candidatus Saccharibacteria bacterium]
MIYLDHAAATPVSERVFEAMKPYFSDDFFNPSAAYLPAKKVASDYENAKAIIAHAIGAKANDIVITAGATEANNLALGVVASAFSEARLEFSSTSYTGTRTDSSLRDEPGRSVRNIRVENSNQHLMLQKKQNATNPQILYLVTEHDSVRKVAEQYGGEAIAVDKNGRIVLEDLKAKITDQTMLISVSLANNELGVIQPISEIAAIIRDVRFDRLKRGIKTPLYLHSDASQAMNLLDINVARLGVDLLTLNAAKVYGPKGVGALYVAHGVKLQPLTRGGGQENGLRSGTENVPGVIGFAKAIAEAKEHLNGNRKKYANWRKILLSELRDYELINKKHVLDNFVVLCYNGIDAERLVFLLEEKGIYVSTGAACAASKGVRSHVLAAIGLSDEEIAGSLRLTMGETNTEEQIHEAAKIINEVVAGERERVTS